MKASLAMAAVGEEEAKAFSMVESSRDCTGVIKVVSAVKWPGVVAEVFAGEQERE